MKRRAFTMKLKSGCAAEYQRRHDEIWPELAKALKDAGVVEYSIFLDEATSTLFAFQNLAEDNAVAALRDSEIMRKWWGHLGDIMEVSADLSPKSRTLREVFYLK
jgi:L-rhamnose mutarotase